MRIIAGQLKRKSIRAPQGHLTRPTTDRTRESLFHLVEARLALREAEVLDLFAGTGALGLEAISRGARFVTFVENERRVMQVARDNADALDVSNQGRFVPGDAVHFLETYNGPPFDLIMADPPYDLDAMDRLPDLALPHVREGGAAHAGARHAHLLRRASAPRHEPPLWTHHRQRFSKINLRVGNLVS
jgi:16S rRNA (guanine(966)-N(2))-methyltransferase RsmD